MKLTQNFYNIPTLALAQALLGKILVRKIGTGKTAKTISAIIVETEGYVGGIDEACHAYKTRTNRNETMYAEPGTLYVYFTYGNHFMANVVSEKKDISGAVLLRAVEPVSDNDYNLMRQYRTGSFKSKLDVCNGPGKLTKAMSIDKILNGEKLTGEIIFIENSAPILQKNIGCTTRIGITRSVELEWRYFIKGNLYVSKSKPS